MILYYFSKTFLVLLNKTKLYLIRKKIFHLGKNVIFYFPLRIEGIEHVSIGDNSAIGTYVHIWGDGGVIIGKDVLIAAHCCISSLNHNYTHRLVREGEIIKKETIIEDDVWLGYGVIVIPGVKIGKGSVIGAGSVVVTDIPSYSIAVGNPARVIKKRIIKHM